jgi:acyl-CoA reductase-like NAD-dependent aldehyde dehydrogenase
VTETRLLIRGEQVAGTGEPLDIENPFTEETIASVALPSAEQVDAAIAAAREAAKVWAQTPAVERGELLHEVATRLRARTAELAELMTREGGKPLVENWDEVGWTAAAFDYYAEMGRNFAGRVIPSIEQTQLALVLKEPMGVVGCIVPWNYPLLLLAWKVAPALAAGNTVVCKPSELTPLSTIALASCFEGFPPGVVNILAGGGEVGEAIVRDERIDCVAFTGSVETGKRIASICAERVARVNLELGGKDPFIVCEDVAGQVEIAAKGGAWAAFLNAGQVCTSAERFYVLEPVFDDFVSAFVDYTESLRVGDPLDPETDIGPLVSARQREKVAAHVDGAVEAGAKLLTGGNGTANGTGHFYSPAVVTGAPAETDLLREETFGPVAPLFRFKSEEEAIDMANDTEFGLACYFYTRDLGRAWRVAEGLEYGMVGINEGIISTEVAPFGGVKESGIGREGSHHGIEEFTEIKYMLMGGLAK